MDDIDRRVLIDVACRFHDLRHTHATPLAQAGPPPRRRTLDSGVAARRSTRDSTQRRCRR